MSAVTAAYSTQSSSQASAAFTPSTTLGKDEFLRLLLLQLRNQDPMNPINDREFISQMAQLSSLEATQGLSTQVDALLFAQMQTQALSMVGKTVEYLDESQATASGQVTGVRLDAVPPKLVIGEHEIPMTSVQKVL